MQEAFQRVHPSSFFPFPTYVFLKSVPNAIPAGPDSARKFAQRNLFPPRAGIYHSFPCPGGVEWGEGGERGGRGRFTRGNEILFYSPTQRYNRISPRRRRK